MRKIKYLFKRILALDYKNMISVCKTICKKENKFFLAIYIDMIICGFKYQAGYYDYLEFEFYNLNRRQRKTYLTRGKNNEIVRKYNNKAEFYKFDNKAEFNKIFDPLLHREWMLIDSNNFEEFDSFFNKHKSIVVKPIYDTGGGRGVDKFTLEETDNNLDLFNTLLSNRQVLIEECIKQHPRISELYDKSVNTLRIYTFHLNGVTHYLFSVFKIGNGGVIDNFSRGGMYTFTDENGVVFVEAIDQEDNIFAVHPISKQPIIGFEVPYIKEAIELVKEAATYLPSMAYVGWDVAIDANGPLIVEGNCFPGVFQVKPSLSKTKTGLIPMYKEIMDIKYFN